MTGPNLGVRVTLAMADSPAAVTCAGVSDLPVPHEHGARADERARAGPRGPGALAPHLQRARSEFRQLAPCLREGLEEFFGARLERYVTSRKQRVKSVALKYKCKMTN